ncbi:RNA polymerase subunit sigma-70 [Kitasatospora sp. NPDC002040]|uniref:RNA polymerase subunit sigma-70 n=1 Tax=Kitasatospora sp. NPDC002040 TaxID=3154661 RepID=UPI00332D68D7
MSDSKQLAAAASSRDPAVGLRAVRALRDLADRLEDLQVGNARGQGWSWQDIAVCLGVSRQAVHKKYAKRGFGDESSGSSGGSSAADGG